LRPQATTRKPYSERLQQLPYLLKNVIKNKARINHIRQTVKKPDGSARPNATEQNATFPQQPPKNRTLDMDTRYLDDLIVGDRFTSGGLTFTEAEIIDFAFRYDPQPFHLDANAAAESPYGGLIASGFQSIAICFRLFIQTASSASRASARRAWTNFAGWRRCAPATPCAAWWKCSKCARPAPSPIGESRGCATPPSTSGTKRC
jgi:hypothetical protein